jgi:hypothetical protein
MDSRFRGSDGFSAFHEVIEIDFATVAEKAESLLTYLI